MYNPLSKGRWYRFFIESDGSATTLVESDLEGATETSNYLKFPLGFHIVDQKWDINAIAGGTNSNIVMSRRHYTDGCQGLPTPAPANYDWAYIYVFGYFA